MQFTPRAMGAADIGACHRLSQQVQWPHRLQDWQLLRHLGHGVVIDMHHGRQAPVVVGTGLHFHFGRVPMRLGAASGPARAGAVRLFSAMAQALG
ncbi:hypothetical protein [Herbaspirillum sp. YR522]|uniref:hypothetical protein n=1 Tax=Herbaspirillum sp. YR522 TaxID=1144342 RepID=UPI00026FCDB3|nr:hypothetical protein [Herbaspirillum sp. YR522]EJM97554.1 hypothetical protein PMI40_04315 [Herbaspirillum sp. YR522]